MNEKKCFEHFVNVLGVLVWISLGGNDDLLWGGRGTPKNLYGQN